MTATVRLDDRLAEKLSRLSESMHKKKSELIREALELYLANAEEKKKSRILKAVEKTKDIDKNEYLSMEGTLDDALEG